MNQIFGRVLCAAALTAGFGLPMAHAAVIDFESDALLGNLYLVGDSFTQGDYTLTTTVGVGFVDTVASLDTQAPTGNATQFYYSGNDGALALTRTDGSLFSLSAFSAAFVTPDATPQQTFVLVAVGTKADNSLVTAYWNFGASLTSHFPFTNYTSAAFDSVKSVEFKTCSLVGTTICSVATNNVSQFAIDNITVSAVPEPTTTALMMLGLLGLGLRARRAAR